MTTMITLVSTENIRISSVIICEICERSDVNFLEGFEYDSYR